MGKILNVYFNNIDDSVIYNGYIYYINSSDDNSIWKCKIDGTENIKLNSSKTFLIQAYNDYIFYINFYDNNHLYKMKIDGTGNTKVIETPINTFLIEDNALYRVNYIANQLIKDSFNNQGSIDLQIQIGSPTKLKFKKYNKFYYINSAYMLVSVEDNTFNYSPKTVSTSVNYVELYNDDIYYTDSNNNLKKYNITSNNISNTIQEKIGFFTILNDYIYYIDYLDNKVYRNNLNFTSKENIISTNVSRGFRIYNNDIFYISSSDNNLYKTEIPPICPKLNLKIDGNTKVYSTGYCKINNTKKIIDKIQIKINGQLREV